MTTDLAERLSHLTRQLADQLMSSAHCVAEIRAILTAAGKDDPLTSSLPQPSDLASHTLRPLLNESTLCVTWAGRSVYLGHTLAFRLLDRLSRRPNQYVTHLDLLHDVWENEELADATVRSVVRHLRRKLRDGGMEDLAAAIRGHRGRYILVL